MSSSDREQSLANAMRAANRGCPQAYDSLLSELAGVLRAMARRALARSPEVDVEDVVQECLLAIHLKRHTWDEQRALLPWVRAIAHHKIVDSVRRRVRANEVLIEPLAESLLAPTAPGSAALP